MSLQLLGDLIHIGLGLVIAGPQGLKIGGRFLKYAQQPLLLLLRGGEALQLRHQGGHHVAQLAHILGPDGVQRCAGEIRDIFLGSGAVLQHQSRIGQVDLIRKIKHRFLLGRRQRGKIRAGLRGRLGLFRHDQLHLGSGGQIRGQGQFGNLFIHGDLSFVVLCPLAGSEAHRNSNFQLRIRQSFDSITFTFYCVHCTAFGLSCQELSSRKLTRPEKHTIIYKPSKTVMEKRFFHSCLH